MCGTVGCGVVGVALVLSAFVEVGVDVNEAISGSIGLSRHEIQRSDGTLGSRCSGGEITRSLRLSIFAAEALLHSAMTDEASFRNHIVDSRSGQGVLQAEL